MIKFPYWIEVDYLLWSCVIRVDHQNKDISVENLIKDTLLTYYNVTPTRKLTGTVYARIYNDETRIHLVDTLSFDRTTKEDFNLKKVVS